MYRTEAILCGTKNKTMTKSLAIFPFLFLFVIYASGQDIWTYERCVQEAFKSNISVRQDNIALERAINDLTASRISRIPDLNGNVNTSLNNGRALDPITYQYSTEKFLYNNYTLQSSLKLFEGGRLNHTITKNVLATDLQKIRLDNTKMNVSKDILIQYTDAQMLTDFYALWSERIELLKQQKEKAVLLVESGRKTQSSIWEIEVEIGKSQQYLEDILYRKEVALLKLKNIISIPLQTPILLAASSNTSSIDSSGYSDKQLDDITISSPAYLESVSQLAIARKDLQLARDLYYPSFTLNGILGTGYSSKITGATNFNDNNFRNQLSNNSYQNLSLNIYIPIFGRLQTHYNVTKYKINEQQSRESQKLKSQQIKELLYIQNSQLKYSAKKYIYVKSSVDNFTLILNEANLNFQSGRIDTFEYLLKQQQKYTMMQSLIELKYNHIIAKKTIELFETGSVSY